MLTLYNVLITIPTVLLLLAACSSSTDAVDSSETSADLSSQNSIPVRPKARRYAVGEDYSDTEFLVKYLGLAELSLGRFSKWRDGKCFSVLAEITRHADSSRSKPESFSPSIRGVLTNGNETENDFKGVNCDVELLSGLGYLRSQDVKLGPGKTEKVWIGAIYVSMADEDNLDGITFYDRSELMMDAVVTVNATRVK